MQKSRSKEKVVGFSLALLFPPRKWEAVTQGGTIEPGGQTIQHRKPREPVLSKVGRTSEIMGPFQIHSRKTRITRGRAL